MRINKLKYYKQGHRLVYFGYWSPSVHNIHAHCMTEKCFNRIQEARYSAVTDNLVAVLHSRSGNQPEVRLFGLGVRLNLGDGEPAFRKPDSHEFFFVIDDKVYFDRRWISVFSPDFGTFSFLILNLRSSIRSRVLL
jgi:hypothetical protein